MKEQEELVPESLYKMTFPLVAKAIWKLGGDLPAARDVFHDALIIYLEKKLAGNLEIRISPQAYITGIARILWVRKFSREPRSIPLEIYEEALEVPEDLYPTAQETDVLEYVKNTGQRCLELLQAFYYRKCSMQDIAAAFHFKTRRSATVQKYKCLEKVREQIKKTTVYEEFIA